MLTAKLRDGKDISLLENYRKSELEELRKREQFNCRVCSQKVILKLGEKRIFHFAHEKGSACTEDHDRESEYHMQGKMKLFAWLKSQGLNPELELYFPAIKQRADIVFSYKGKTYCLEFQCSTISEEQFKKRTEGYLSAKLLPIWILGGKNIHRTSANKASLTSFQYLFMRESSTNQIFLPSYCPQANVFTILNNIIPITTRNTYCHFSITHLMRYKLSDLFNLQSTFSLTTERWKGDMLNYKKQLQIHAPSLQDPFLLELYSRAINPYHIPPYVGLPLEKNIAIETAPFIWQAYIFLDFLYQQKEEKEIQFQQVYTSILRRVRNKQIKIRTMPCIKRNLLPFAVADYLCALERAEILRKIKNNVFVIDKPIIIANNMDNWLGQQEELFERYFSQ